MKSESDHMELVKNVEGLKGFSKSDDVTFFYFLDDHPSFNGIAYSNSSKNPIRTGQNLQNIDIWFRLYGNWYFWYAGDPY